MSVILFRNVKIVDPQSPHHEVVSDILVEDDQIIDIAAAGSITDESIQLIIEEDGLHVSPGWIDLCVELREPGYEWKETMQELAQAAASGGFTDILCYPNTLPCIDHSQVVSFLRSKANELSINFHFTGTLTHGYQGRELSEMYELHQAGVLAYTDGHDADCVPEVLLRALQYVNAFDGLVINYPSETSLTSLGHMNEGDQSVILGMKGIPELAEYTTAYRNVMYANYTGTRLHLQPISSPDTIEQIYSITNGNSRITSGVAIPYIALDDSAVSTFHTHYKIFPPLRAPSQVQQLKNAIGAGKIDILCTGHAAQGPEEKNQEFALAEYGMLGLQTAFSLALMQLVEPGYINLSRWIELISINPRKILKLPVQTIQKDRQANLTLFNPVKEWVLSSDAIPSRAKNTPFTGRTLLGKIKGIYTKNRWIETN